MGAEGSLCAVSASWACVVRFSVLIGCHCSSAVWRGLAEASVGVKASRLKAGSGVTVARSVTPRCPVTLSQPTVMSTSHEGRDPRSHGALACRHMRRRALFLLLKPTLPPLGYALPFRVPNAHLNVVVTVRLASPAGPLIPRRYAPEMRRPIPTGSRG
jgi:hypothetical protein